MESITGSLGVSATSMHCISIYHPTKPALYNKESHPSSDETAHKLTR